MELHKKKTDRLGLCAAVAAVMACVAACYAFVTRPALLTGTESRCVGSWAYICPDAPTKRCVVYHFAADRRVREEHYYLSSAWPTVPRITMVGRWSIDKDGRMTVEPDQGISYVGHTMSGWLNEYFDNGRQAWERPILTRFYDVKSATNTGIHVECSRSGGGHIQFTMLPFRGDPRTVTTP
jgi:hypothetical protein